MHEKDDQSVPGMAQSMVNSKKAGSALGDLKNHLLNVLTTSDLRDSSHMLVPIKCERDMVNPIHEYIFNFKGKSNVAATLATKIGDISNLG